ncbi:MAG: tRNA threonylcarbamoyladenosine dehydratase [Tissierellia bacterium]|nr:tRNA threonylcarbamoyladenosine dehydratase [Tissierellia bacterium]
MTNQFDRTITLLGDDYNRIVNKKVIIFGIGGVGAACALALARIGIKKLTFVDFDRVDITNLNRQIFTDLHNVGMFKCIALKEYIERINTEIIIDYKIKKVLNNLNDFNLSEFDYVVDAIDLITAKLNLIEYCSKNNINIISSMGTGNRIDASKLQIVDIFSTKNDPLAKVVRRELKKRNVKKLDVVCSDEIPLKKSVREEERGKSTPSSISFVPPVSGYIMASYIIKKILKGNS